MAGGHRESNAGSHAGGSSSGSGSRKAKKCGICRQEGHDRRSCPHAPGGGAAPTHSGKSKLKKGKASAAAAKRTGNSGFQIGTAFDDFG